MVRVVRNPVTTTCCSASLATSICSSGSSTMSDLHLVLVLLFKHVVSTIRCLIVFTIEATIEERILVYVWAVLVNSWFTASWVPTSLSISLPVYCQASLRSLFNSSTYYKKDWLKSCCLKLVALHIAVLSRVFPKYHFQFEFNAKRKGLWFYYLPNFSYFSKV